MKFVADREKLHDGFRYVGSVITSTISRPLYQNVKLEVGADAISLSATDLEVGLKVQVAGVDVQEPGTVLLPETRLSSILASTPDEKVSFAGDETAVTIETSDSRFRILAEPADEFADIPEPEGEEIVEVDPEVLRYMVRSVVFAAADEKGRYALNGVLVVVNKEGDIEMVAADGARLALVKKKVANPGGAEVRSIVVKRGVEQLSRLAGLSQEPVRFGATQNQFLAANDVGVLCCQLVEGQFPNYQQVMPAQQPTRLELPTTALLNAVTRAALVTTERANAVDFHLSAGKLTLTSESPELGESEVRLEVDYDGEPTEISFNPDFIEQALKVMERESVKLQFSDRASPATMKSGLDFTYVLSPVVTEEATG